MPLNTNMPLTEYKIVLPTKIISYKNTSSFYKNWVLSLQYAWEYEQDSK